MASLLAILRWQMEQISSFLSAHGFSWAFFGRWLGPVWLQRCLLQ
jgi:hypothetical protein